MSELDLIHSGYVCAPYSHTHESVELKESWAKSRNIEKLFFVTGTFSSDSKPYFANFTNHYLLAKFKNNSKIFDDLSKHNQEKTSFVLIFKMIFFNVKLKEQLILFQYITWNMGKTVTIYTKLQIFY